MYISAKPNITHWLCVRKIWKIKLPPLVTASISLRHNLWGNFAVLKAVFMDHFPLEAMHLRAWCHMEFPERTIVLLSLKPYES